METDSISPSDVLYIKLGKGGEYEQKCIEQNQTLRLGYTSVPHDLCLRGEWDQVLEQREQRRGNPRSAAADLTQIRLFYRADETVLWVTFYRDRLYWCFSRPELKLLPDNTKTRPVIGRWSCEDITGVPLDKSRLSGKLLSMQGFRGTICSVKESEYLVQKINGHVPHSVRKARTSRSDLEGRVEALICDLYWKDFEILVDLVFRQAGWRRVSQLGKSLRTLDLELVSSITSDRYGVQVKSEADLAEFEEYEEMFTEMQGYRRLYFIVHSPSPDLRQADPAEGIEIWFPDDIAHWVVKYGLTDWVIAKAS